MFEETLKKIAAQKETPSPTPPIGTMVNWFERNEEEMRFAAVVTRIQGAGKVELAVQKPRHHVIHKQGVLYRGDPIHEKRANPATVAAGSWDYIEGVKIPHSHFSYHLNDLERQEKAIRQEIKSREDDAARLAIAKGEVKYKNEVEDKPEGAAQRSDDQSSGRRTGARKEIAKTSG